MSSVIKSFGNNVRQERLKKGLSQEEFAELVGLHRTYIGMVERGEKNITIKNIEKIAKALEIPLNELMNLEK
jgi:transcriptional regulator with XRE-family HTH domain